MNLVLLLVFTCVFVAGPAIGICALWLFGGRFERNHPGDVTDGAHHPPPHHR